MLLFCQISLFFRNKVSHIFSDGYKPELKRFSTEQKNLFKWEISSLPSPNVRMHPSSHYQKKQGRALRNFLFSAPFCEKTES